MKTARSTTAQEHIAFLYGIELKTLLLTGLAVILLSSLFTKAMQNSSDSYSMSSEQSAEHHIAFTSRYLRINEYLFHGKELAKALV